MKWSCPSWLQTLRTMQNADFSFRSKLSEGDSVWMMWRTSKLWADFVSRALAVLRGVAWKPFLFFSRRLSYPNKSRELAEEFGRSKAALSIIFNTTLIWFTRQWGHILEIRSPGLILRRLVLKRILLLLLLRLVSIYVRGVLSTGLSVVLYAGHIHRSAALLQRPQESTCSEIPGGCYARWTVCTPSWPCGGTATRRYAVCGEQFASIASSSDARPCRAATLCCVQRCSLPLEPFSEKGIRREGAALTVQQARYNGNFSIARMCVE